MAKSGISYSQASLVKYGYGQVEGNHLTAKRDGRVYAQLPAAADINVLENGQFVKYDYANKVCNFTGPGEWFMVYNEVKIYHERETDADFAMIKQNYNARVYSPVGQNTYETVKGVDLSESGFVREGTDTGYAFEYGTYTYPQMMPDGTKMVPRVIGIAVGNLWTTNTINATIDELAEGTMLKIGATGILEVGEAADGEPKFQVVKRYTMPDLQPGVKVMRLA